jgi:hypothetical protein
MARGLFVHRIDQIEGAAGEMALVGLRVNPDGKEFGAQISPMGLVKADVAHVFGIGGADIETFVKKSLGRVGVGVNDDGGIVNLSRPRADDYVRGVRWFFWRLG